MIYYIKHYNSNSGNLFLRNSAQNCSGLRKLQLDYHTKPFRV